MFLIDHSGDWGGGGRSRERGGAWWRVDPKGTKTTDKRDQIGPGAHKAAARNMTSRVIMGRKEY